MNTSSQTVRQLSDKQIEAARKTWEESSATARSRERRSEFTTGSGLPVAGLYTDADVPVNYLGDLGFPGEFPFTRGVQPTMYRGRFWTMRQYAGFASALESNRRYKYLLEQGQTGLSVAFDLPTQLGLDADDPLAAGEVGRVGVSVSSLADMEVLLNGLPLDRVSTSMTINAPAAVLLAMYVAVAEKQGVPLAKLSGTIQNDILKEYVARGTYIFPPEPSLRLITDTFSYCAENLPEWNTISISGYHMREAGATAVQEVAFTLANGLEYVRRAIAVGLDVDVFAPRLSFFFNAHNEFFEEVAKFRAARRLWAKLMRDRIGAKNPRSWMLRFHTQTAGSTLTAQQPDNNVVRVTLQALAAVLGGTQSLHTNSRDEALALPTEDSARLALRTQQIIANESGAADTVDPLAGSYYVENMTNQVEAEALSYIDRIDALGGSAAAIERGFLQREIQEAAYRHQRLVETGDRVVVGLNRFAASGEAVPDLLRIDPAVEERQVGQLAELRRQRDNAAAQRALEDLQAAAHGDANLVPFIVTAVKAYATLGEITGGLRAVFGEYQPGAEV
ncbi:MAG: acyl-CoA mutase large subunit family protein [Symbiobacteriia bacterium]